MKSGKEKDFFLWDFTGQLFMGGPLHLRYSFLEKIDKKEINMVYNIWKVVITN